MLTSYLKRETTRTTYYASPAGSYLDEFTDWLARCGFHEEVICQYLPGTIRFAAWGCYPPINRPIRLVAHASQVLKRYSSPVGLPGRRWVRPGSGSWQGHYLGAELTWTRFSLSHFRLRRATSMQTGPRPTRRWSADAPFVSAIRLSDTHYLSRI
jgi:hypothetical protein